MEERGGKENKWTDCVQSDIRAFGITAVMTSTCSLDNLGLCVVFQSCVRSARLCRAACLLQLRHL